jgi:putative redox protein
MDNISNSLFSAGIIESNFSFVNLFTEPQLSYTMSNPRTITAHNSGQHYKTTVTNGTHKLTADEPTDNGGADTSFSPHELLASSLASCTAITVRMYADRKEWDLKEVIVEVNTLREIINGAARADFEIVIQLAGNLDKDQKSRLLDIAKKCPVHRTLLGAITIKTELR